MSASYRSDRDEWPWTPPPEAPPESLESALATPLRLLAGCWIESRCLGSSLRDCGCRNTKDWPIRMLLTDRRERAEMPLRRAVNALHRCPGCQADRRLALVSDPK